MFSDGKVIKYVLRNGKRVRIVGLSLFKTGIRPEWEDKANLGGGEWACKQSTVLGVG